MKKQLIKIMAYLSVICLICTGCFNNSIQNSENLDNYKRSEADNAPIVYITDPDGNVFVREENAAIIGWSSQPIFKIDGEDAVIGYCPDTIYHYVYKTENEDCLCLMDPRGNTKKFFREGFDFPDFDDKTIDSVEIYYSRTEKLELKNKDKKKELIDFIASKIFIDDGSGTDEPLDYYAALWFYDEDSGLETGYNVYSNEEGSRFYFIFKSLVKSDVDKEITVYEVTRRCECTEIMEKCGLIKK